jgi:hypothetical protein
MNMKLSPSISMSEWMAPLGHSQLHTDFATLSRPRMHSILRRRLG